MPEPNVSLLNEPLLNEPQPRAPARDEPQSKPVIPERPIRQKVPGKTPGSHKKRSKALVATASAGLVCVLIGLVYVGMRSTVMPDQPAPVTRQIERQVETVDASRQIAVQEAVEEAPTEEATIKEAVLKEAPPENTPEIALSGRDDIPAKSNSAPAQALTPATTVPERTVVTATPPKELTADDISSIPTTEAAKPLSQNRPTPEVANREAPKDTAIPQKTTAATPKNTRSRRTTQNPVSRPED